MALIRGLDHVLLYVQDMDRAVAFYRDVVGVPVRFQGDVWSELDTGDVFVGLHKTGEDTRSQGRGVGAKVVFRVDDVGAAVDALRGKGVEIVREPEAINPETGERVAEFRDPEGNYVSLYGK
jgi:lactoylglutathione lyase